MKNSNSKILMFLACLIYFIAVPAKSWGHDNIILYNHTSFSAQFIIYKDQQVMAKLPHMEPGQQLTIPTDNAFGSTFTIYAVINGITTDYLTTQNPNAIITAEKGDDDFSLGYFVLQER